MNGPFLPEWYPFSLFLRALFRFSAFPIAQYPEIVPPVVQVTAYYPGADPQVIAETVAAPIEQQVNGVENMLYMSSQSAADGSYTLNVTFELGTDIDMNTVLTQNRVSAALAQLPEDVQRQGVTTKKVSSALVLLVSVFSPDNRYDDLFVTNYVNDKHERYVEPHTRSRQHSLISEQGLLHAVMARRDKSAGEGSHC